MLEAENQRLSQQIKRLMAAENKLYTLQGNLSAQQRVYVRLAELARNLNTELDVEQILRAVVEFALYGFEYERCVALIEDSFGESSNYRVVAFDGYFDPAASDQVKGVVLTGEESVLAPVFSDPGFVCHSGPDLEEDARALGRLVLMDEYFVFALAQKSGRPLGFLIAGNTKEQARYQAVVAKDARMLAAFSNLASHTATAIGQVRSFRALQNERELLDQMVAARTRELSEALDTAHEAVRIKAEFLAKVSHELRTPLNSIINIPTALLCDYTSIEVLCCAGCGAEFQSNDGDADASASCPDCQAALGAERRRRCDGDSEEHARFLELLQQQGAHLLSLVEDVLDISRLESGKVELNYTLVDVGPLLSEIKSTLASANRGTDRRISYPTLAAPITLVADRVKLKQILINLIGNAIKFTHPGGEIRVTAAVTSTTPGTVEFEVADDGIGIPEDQLDAIFESFRQVDGSHTRSFGGAGLGLAICRQLVEMHGGTITVQSRLNEGSVFRVSLPADQRIGDDGETAVPEHAKSSLPAVRGFGTVIVVDNDPAQLSLARRLLEREGYEVVLLSASGELIPTIDRHHPRLVILEVAMSDVDGLTLLAQIHEREATAQLPVFLSSAFPSSRKRVVDVGGLWLPKPWADQSLTARSLEAQACSTRPTSEGRLSPQRPLSWSRLSDSVSHILYVEDEDANWEVTRLSLRGEYELVRARNSREAFEQLARRDFDLILMDVQLAGSDLSGIEITEALTGRRTRDLPEYALGVTTTSPIVVVTAYASLYSREQLLASGARELVTKPVDFTHLLLVMSRLMLNTALSGTKSS